MNKSITLKRKDVRKVIVKQLIKSRWWAIAFIGLYLIMAILAIIDITINHKEPSKPALSTISLGIIFLVLGLVLFFRYVHYVCKSFFGKDDSIEFEVCFNESDMTIISTKGKHNYDYSLITAIKDYGQFIVIIVDKNRWLILPKNSLSTEEKSALSNGISEFVAFCKNSCKN